MFYLNIPFYTTETTYGGEEAEGGEHQVGEPYVLLHRRELAVQHPPRQQNIGRAPKQQKIDHSAAFLKNQAFGHVLMMSFIGRLVETIIIKFEYFTEKSPIFLEGTLPFPNLHS